MKLSTATKLFTRLSKAELEPRLTWEREDDEPPELRISVPGSGGKWLNRGELDKVLRAVDAADDDVEARVDDYGGLSIR